MGKLTSAMMAFLILTGADVIFAQQKTEPEPQNLSKYADDVKYANAVQFLGLKLNDKAAAELREYLEIYLNGNHRADAYRKLGEIHSKKYDYQKAADIYRLLYEEFSTGDDGIEGYYLMGLCYYKMGYEDKAADIFRNIIETYGESSFSSRAQLQLELLKIVKNE